MSHLPSDVIAEFQSISRERLDKLGRSLLKLDDNPQAEGVADEMMREAHTLKGDARILGFDPLVALVHHIEDLLQQARARQFADKELFDVILSGFDVVQATLAEDLGQPLSTPARALIDTFVTRSSTGAGAGPVESLRTECAAVMHNLREWTQTLDADATAQPAVTALPATLAHLKGLAQQLGLSDFHVHLWSLEAEALEVVSLDAFMFGSPDIVLKGLDVLETALAEGLGDSVRNDLLTDFLEVSLFDPDERAAEEAGEAPEADAPTDEPTPVCADILDTFQAGAVERVENLSRCIFHLEDNPGDEAVADELLRDAHTLKGDSRVVGLMDLGHLIHRFEDLLLLARKGGFSDSGQLDLALSGVDLIQQVVSADLTQPVAEDVAASTAAYLQAIDRIEQGQSNVTPLPMAKKMAAPAKKPADTAKKGPRREFLHVPVERVEHLIHLAGELNLRQTQQDRIVADMRRLVHDGRDALARFREEAHLPPEVAEKFGAFFREMGARIQEMRDDGFQNGLRLTELQDSVSGMQLVEVRSVFGKYPRAVRSMCKDLGKQCAVVLEGEEVAVDKKVLMQIEDALLHLVRNSVDHGIERPIDRLEAGKPERGTLRLTARNKGAFVEVEIADDGGGIDARKIASRLVSKGLASEDEVEAMSEEQVLQQIFRPGFSTVEQVTDISGRGVGMDVVKRQIDGMGGSVTIHTEVGVGTRFLLRLPVSASVTQAMVFRQDKGLYAVPSAMIDCMLHVLPSAVQWMGGRALLRHEDELISLHDLDTLLGFPSGRSSGRFWRVVLLRLGERRMAVRVRAVLGERKLVQQASDQFLSGLSLMSGTARIEGGELVTVLNAAHVFARAEAGTGGATLQTTEPAAPPAVKTPPAAEPPTESTQAAAHERTVLIVEDSDITRRMLVASVGRLGYRVLEAVNGRDGLEMALRNTPDLIMTDLDMPVMTGIEMLRQLRRTDLVTPVVVMTSRESADSRKEALDSGANAYLVKSRDAAQSLRQAFNLLLDTRDGRAA